jgi:hypothetical protein
MKVYEVECGAVITLAAQDMRKAALHGAAVFKDNPHLIYVRAVHERNLEPAWEDPSPKNSQKKESMLQSGPQLGGQDRLDSSGCGKSRGTGFRNAAIPGGNISTAGIGA